MQFENNATRTCRDVLLRVARLFVQNRLVEDVDRIPLEMNPRGRDAARCCVYKDRAMTKYRCMAVMGHNAEHETDELTPLSEYARLALARERVEGPVLTVLAEACTACVRSRYEVTNVCRGCLARPCVTGCPRQAISFRGGQAHIAAERCANCGHCLEECPYHAIIRIPIPCEEACPVSAIVKDEGGRARIDHKQCVNCGRCRRACPFGAIMERSQTLDVLKALRGRRLVAAILAPAAAGQFGGDMGRLAAGLGKLGFAQVVEAAAGADRTAAHEAAELAERLARGEKVMTTSCCPAFVAAVRARLPALAPAVSSSASPMRFSADWTRARWPDAVTVFIGPCEAKRAEALDTRSVDYVLTFEELGSILAASGVEIDKLEPAALAAEGRAKGRGFAVAGGVGRAVQACAPEGLEVKPLLIDGLGQKNLGLVKAYLSGKCPGNLLELMACPGGCVAGPGAVTPPMDAARQVGEHMRRAVRPPEDPAAVAG